MTAAGSATVVRERCGRVLSVRRPRRRSQVRKASRPTAYPSAHNAARKRREP